ncbi:MAG: DHA2 family efflux MFS transporter permease subunit [Aquabacterium sp.]|jgi:DHA2 family multidrug resistance protein|nr:MAG: DHA2 family efflux MFS transporter permease subunit [Aquabacterium sp.]
MTTLTANPDDALPGAGAKPAPAAPPARPAAHPPLTGAQLVLGTLALSAATFMNVLDTSIANVSIPAISGDLGVSPTQGTWVITSFGVANAISVPLTGWLAQRFGTVRLFITSVLLFVLSSWACGLAPSIEALIAMRVLQGAVAGPMIPLSQTLLLASYPPAKAGMALAMWAITTLVAPVVGPLLGGWITDNISWPWIFYINVPVGLLAAAATWAVYRKRDTPGRRIPIDKIGLGLLVLWVGSMQIALDKGKELDWFSSPVIVGLFVIAAIGLAAFLAWELTEEHPIVDLTLFKRRNYWISTLVLSVAYGLFFGNVVLLPLWLQQFMGYTATQAGMALAPVGLFAILLSPYVGSRVSKVDPRWFTTIALATFALVLFMRSRFSTDADQLTIMIPTLIQGIAMAFFFIPLVTIALGGIEPHRIPAASGLNNFMRITAGSFGTSIFSTMWEDRASMHHAQLVEHITSADPAAQAALGNLGNAGFSASQSAAMVNRLIDQQAAMLSADELFMMSSVLFLCLIGVIWLARPVRATTGSSDAAAGAH